MRAPAALLTMCVAVLATPILATAASHLVRADGTGDYPTIQAAIDASQSGDEVVLADGTFTGEGNRDLSFGKSLTLRSQSGTPSACRIDCQGAARALQLDAEPTVRIEGIKFTRGYAAFGGAILLNNAPEIRNCIFYDNFATSDGAAIYVSPGGNPYVTDCYFGLHETGAPGHNGSVLCGNASVRSCRFEGNYARALFMVSGEAVIDSCTFFENHCGGGAGAMWLECCSHVAIRDCEFRGNTGSIASAVIGVHRDGCYNECLYEVERCVFTGNAQPPAEGSPIYFYAPDSPSALEAVIRGCTFAGEGCQPGWPAILLDIGPHPGSRVGLENTIIAFGTGSAVVSGFDTPVTASCCDIYGNSEGDWTGPLEGQLGLEGNISVDPQFCNLAAGDAGITWTSPCRPDAQPECGLIGAGPVGCGLGVCCLGTACEILTESECTGVGGRFRALWMSCDPNPCPAWVQAGFSASPREGWPPLYVDFTDESVNSPTEWRWDLDGDGETDSYVEEPVWTYTVPGLYDVEQRVANDATADSLRRSNYIRVYDRNNMFIQTTTITESDAAPIPVSFRGQDAIGALSLHFEYDSGVLAYDGVESYVPGETFVGGVVGGRISVQWFDETGGEDPIIPGVDPDTLFAIRVRSLVAQDTTRVAFDRALCTLGDAAGDPIPVTWADEPPLGMVYINTGAVLSGWAKYFWLARPIPDVHVRLMPGNVLVETSADGSYALPGQVPGTYTVTFAKSTDTGGINSLDAIKVVRHSTGLETLDEPYKLIAADVNEDHQINALDALKIVRAAVGLQVLPSGNWRFYPDSVVVPLEQDARLDATGVRMGDVNGDWLPDSRAGRSKPGGRNIVLMMPDTTVAPGMGSADIPIRVCDFYGIGAVSLRIAFADSVLECSGVLSLVPGVSYTWNAVPGEVRLEWYDATGGANPINLGTGTLLELVFDTVGAAGDASPLHFRTDCALGDAEGNPIPGVVYIDGALHLAGGSGVDGVPVDVRAFRFCPVALAASGGATTMLYELPERSRVVLRIHDLTGRVIAEVLDGWQAPGGHEVIWRQRDRGGHLVPSGVYWASFRAGAFHQSRKILVVD